MNRIRISGVETITLIRQYAESAKRTLDVVMNKNKRWIKKSNFFIHLLFLLVMNKNKRWIKKSNFFIHLLFLVMTTSNVRFADSAYCLMNRISNVFSFPC